MKRADMEVGMEVAIGSGAFPTRGVVLSPEVLPILCHRDRFTRIPTVCVPRDVSEKTNATVAVVIWGGEWEPKHIPLSRIKPWATHEAEQREREAVRKRDDERAARVRKEWLELRERIATMAEQVGLSVVRDEYAVRVDGVALYDTLSADGRVFPVSTVEKLLTELVARRESERSA